MSARKHHPAFQLALLQAQKEAALQREMDVDRAMAVALDATEEFAEVERMQRCDLMKLRVGAPVYADDLKAIKVLNYPRVCKPIRSAERTAAHAAAAARAAEVSAAYAEADHWMVPVLPDVFEIIGFDYTSTRDRFCSPEREAAHEAAAARTSSLARRR